MERKEKNQRRDGVSFLVEVRKKLRFGSGVLWKDRPGFLEHCSGKNDFGELFNKWGKLHLRNACSWHQFLLKLKHRPRFGLGLHWNEGQLQMDLLCILHISQHWGARLLGSGQVVLGATTLRIDLIKGCCWWEAVWEGVAASSSVVAQLVPLS